MNDRVRQFGGEERFGAPIERVFAVVADLDRMAQNIPDATSIERVDASTLRCVVRPGFSFLRGTLKLSITIDELEPPRRAAMRIDAKGIGVAMRVVSRIELAPDGDGSRLTWDARIDEMSGLVATVSPALVKAAADQVIRHSWEQVRRQLE